MRSCIIAILVYLCAVIPVPAQDLNLDMEDVGVYAQPLTWRMGHPIDKPIVYWMVADSVVKHGGRYSMKLFSNSNRAAFASSFIVIPVPPNSKKVTLRGFVKTKDISQGIGTLFLSLLENDTTVVLWDNLFVTENRLSGTKDWTEMTISQPVSEKVTMISFGGMITGAGTVWVDDLVLLVDNKPIVKATVLQPYVKDPQTKKMRKF